MRTIERASAFKRDYKRVKATPRHGKDVDSLVSSVVGCCWSIKFCQRATVTMSWAAIGLATASATSSQTFC